MDKDLGEGTSRDEEEDLGVSDLPSNQLKRIYENEGGRLFNQKAREIIESGGLNLKNVMTCDKEHTVSQGVMAINRLVCKS